MKIEIKIDFHSF